MKKIWRIVACVLIAALLCVCLCGCGALDKMRANHAFWTENGNIRLGDTEYILLPDCAELQPALSVEQWIHVTAADVPVLLSSLLGTQCRLSEDAAFLWNWETSAYYCRADRHDEILARIQNGFTPAGYGYTYYDYEADKECYYALTAAQAAAVEAVYTNTAGQIMPEMAEIYFEFSVDLMQHSEDRLFRRNFVTVGVVANAYYLLENTDDGMMLYEVPAEYNAAFASLLSAFEKAEFYWQEDFFDDPYSDVYEA